MFLYVFVLVILCNYSRKSMKINSYSISQYTGDDMICVSWALMINTIDILLYRYMYISTNQIYARFMLYCLNKQGLKHFKIDSSIPYNSDAWLCISCQVNYFLSKLCTNQLFFMIDTIKQ